MDKYPSIYISATDPDLPSWFSNDFPKYCNFKDAGAGGGGVLQTTFDNNLGREVMIKRLPPEQNKDPRHRRRLLREARITAQLQHPNTVPVYEMGKDDDGHIYFAMKKIAGENLFRILTRIARQDADTMAAFSLPRLLGVVIHASSALGSAHAQGVIHRDVKPENIMVGRFNEVVLMDWGVAKVWGIPDDIDTETPDEELFERLTVTGKRPGTPLYMSPEQVRGDAMIDGRSDIFSMGVVLYESLALREPFRGHNVKETFHNIQHSTPPAPSEVCGRFKLPRQIDDIVMRAISKSADERYSNIQQMINDIRAVRNQGLTDADRQDEEFMT